MLEKLKLTLSEIYSLSPTNVNNLDFSITMGEMNLDMLKAVLEAHAAQQDPVNDEEVLNKKDAVDYLGILGTYDLDTKTLTPLDTSMKGIKVDAKEELRLVLPAMPVIEDLTLKFLNPYEVTYEPNVVKHWSDPRPIGRLAGKTLYTAANKIPDFFTATRPTADDHSALKKGRSVKLHLH